MNLSSALSEKQQVYVLTSDRDLNDTRAYPGVQVNQWIEFKPNLQVCYLSPSHQTLKHLYTFIIEVEAKVIYLNSLFSQVFTIYPLFLKWRKQLHARVILAPRGMLRESALSFKPLKKKLFIQTLRWIQISNWVDFHATDKQEIEDIHHHLGIAASIFLIPNYPVPVSPYFLREKQNPTSFLFLGRVHPIKGLLEALSFFKKKKLPIIFSIIGSKEIKSYWDKCQEITDSLPPNVKVNFLGELPPNEVKAIQKEHDFFLLPTKGENFGHAIFEALSMGMPVIISDQTPWKALQNLGVGWDIPLNEPSQFTTAISEAILMRPEQYQKMSKAAWQYAKDFIGNSHLEERYLTMFGFATDLTSIHKR